mgnify:CR=1 FL=1
MSEFERRRIYYTKNQVEIGLVTLGEEWMFTDGTEYVGQYHKYITDEVFSKPTFIKGKSRKLIPYVNVNDIGTLNSEGVDLAKNFLYDEIKSVDVKKTKTPNKDIEPIKEKDLKNGFFIRYVAYKFDDTCIELNKDKYGKIGTDKGLSDVLYTKLEVKWKITGNLYDIKDDRGNIIEAGIFDTNKRTIALLSEDYPSLKSKFINYLEFYQP